MTDQDQNKRHQGSQPTARDSVVTAESNRQQSLDQLFAGARLERAELADDNFTKIVMNRLPINPLRINKRGFLADAVGLLIGLLVAWRFFEPQIVASKWLSLFPSNISISLSNILLVSAALSLAAVMAWWSVERKASF
jgi:hypothetical protein